MQKKPSDGKAGSCQDNPKNPECLYDALIRLLNMAAAIEKEPVDIGGGVYLHASEVHFIDILGRYPGENLSCAAKRLGITKGAVSQTALKLEKKGCIKRVKVEGDGKKITAVLTDTGNKAFLWHRNYHAVMNEKILSFSGKLDDDEFKKLNELLLCFGDLFESCISLRRESSSEIKGGEK